MSTSRRCLILFLCAGFVWGQLTRRSSPPAARLSSSASRKSKKSLAELTPPRPLLVDAVAVGADGKPVVNLTAADFALKVRGEAQSIAAVSYVNTESGTFAPAIPGIALKPDEVHRTLVIVADDLGLSAEGSIRVRRALQTLLERMNPRDVAAILRTAAGQGNLQALTEKRSVLAAAVNGIGYNPIAGMEAAHASGAREVLRQALNGLRALSGKKTVVLLTENPRLLEASPESSLAELPDRVSAVVSVVDARSGAPAGEKSGLADFARRTGGRTVTGQDVPAALAEVLHEDAGYYLVAYKPHQATTDVSTGKSIAQNVELSTTRAGVQLRARQGTLQGDNFFTNAEASTRWRPTFTTPAADLSRGVTNPFAGGDIRVRLAATFSMAKLFPGVDNRFQIEAQDLSWVRNLNGETTSSLDVVVAVFNEHGASEQTERHGYALRLTKDTLQTAMERGFVASVRSSLRSGGDYQVRVTVRDGVSGRIGSASQFVHAPDAGSGQLALGGMVLAVAEDGPERTVLRSFLPGQTFRLAYQILNLTADDAKRSQATIETRILRDGEAVFASKERTIEFTANDNPKLRTAATEMKLGTALQPGNYVIEVQISDKLAKEPRTVRQYESFEVREPQR